MSKWSEIRNNFIDETHLEKDSVTLYIDAWKSSNSNEEGRVIATITLSNMKEKPEFEINYKDLDAKKDKYAQEIIREGIEILKEKFLH